jgi:hypothetical protein
MSATKYNEALFSIMSIDHGGFIVFNIEKYAVHVQRASKERERTVYSLTGRDYKLFDVSFMGGKTFVLHPVGMCHNYLGRELARRMRGILGKNLHESE